MQNKLLTIYKRVIDKSISRFIPFIQVMNYRGFKLYYSKGTSLIKMINKSPEKIYEQKENNAVIKYLKNKNPLTILDIGANIGLFSLNIIAELSQAKIYSFEPGPHQFNLFQKTISNNKLLNTIELSNIALSNKSGIVSFATHDSKDVSGDGFIDTGRAGKSTIIEVQTTTLDKWWKEKKCPIIDFIKIDTEGAELLILEGGIDLIKSSHPIIFLEIFEGNLVNYPYKAIDVLSFIHKIEYSLFSLENELIEKDNLESHLKKNVMFFAIWDNKRGV